MLELCVCMTYFFLCSSNILLYKHFAAKLSDFGFSIQLPARKANKTVVTAVEGLPGTDGIDPLSMVTGNLVLEVTSTLLEWYVLYKSVI